MSWRREAEMRPRAKAKNLVLDSSIKELIYRNKREGKLCRFSASWLLSYIVCGQGGCQKILRKKSCRVDQHYRTDFQAFHRIIYCVLSITISQLNVIFHAHPFMSLSIKSKSYSLLPASLCLSLLHLLHSFLQCSHGLLPLVGQFLPQRPPFQNSLTTS